MVMIRKYVGFILILVMCSPPLFAQVPDSSSLVADEPVYTIGDIIIKGNKKTKPSIILRELPFQTGDRCPLKDLVKKFEMARQQLSNTTLFHSVMVAAAGFEGNVVHIAVDLKERWYLFPLPYFKPVDRNLNQWLVEQKASLSRVNYGVKITHNNSTGRNDKFNLWLINGYTKQITLNYGRAYIDKKLKWGMGVSFSTGKYHEVNSNTQNDKQVFFKSNDEYVRSFSRLNIGVSYRKAIKTRHVFGVSYNMEKISDTIAALNPSYFNNGYKKIRFPGIYYSLSYYDVDYIPYPTRGYAMQASISKNGFGPMNNLWSFFVKGLGSWHLRPKTFFSLNAYAGLKLPLKQPYFNQRLLGYNEMFLQGYEYYVIDGVAGAYLKTTLHHQFLRINIKIPPRKKGADPEWIPFRIIGKVYGNTGYVYNPDPGENSLPNKMLYSGGIGIDIVTFYDLTFKLEWSFNQLGQNGLFLHRRNIF